MAVVVHDAAPDGTYYLIPYLCYQATVIGHLTKVTDIDLQVLIIENTPGRCGNTFRDEDCLIKEIFKKRCLCGLYWSDIVIHLLFDNCDAKVMIISMTVSIFATANKEEGALVVKPGPFNFNHWKRIEKAGSDTSFFYCMGGGMGKSVYLFLQKETWHHEQDYKQARP